MIPSFEELASRLSGKKIFSVLDLKDGYWQVGLGEQTSRLCTFSTPFGCYKFLRLPFGIKVAPELFQKFNEKNFEGISGVSVYIDDVLIAADNIDEHNNIMKKVIKRAISLNIKFNASKLQYCVNKVKYLGHIIYENGIECDPDRVIAINKIEQPKNKKDLQKLLGLVNYVRKYIPN